MTTLEKTQSPKKIVLGFNQSSFNDELSRIESITKTMADLAPLLSAAGIKSVDVGSLLSDPYTTLLEFVPEDIRQFISNLQNQKLYNWSKLPEIYAIIVWAEAKSWNTYVPGYWNAFDLSTGELKAEYMETLRERHTIYCRSEAQAKVLEKVQAAARLLNEAQLIAPDRWLDSYGDTLELAKPFIREGREYAVNTKFIALV